ncbi:MAG: Imm44 family immunity protein [Firmicutes bacterium]|nr:Imm44 family immunity protein [Bacillota bacterium]
MYIFLTGEVSFEIGVPFGKTLRDISEKLKAFSLVEDGGLLLPSDDTYGTEFKNITIVTTILGESRMFPGENTKGMWKERRLIRRKEKCADIRLEIDYDKFVDSDKDTQMLLHIKNIVDSIMAVEERKKSDFKGQQLIDDILLALGVSKDQLANL